MNWGYEITNSEKYSELGIFYNFSHFLNYMFYNTFEGRKKLSRERHMKENCKKKRKEKKEKKGLRKTVTLLTCADNSVVSKN